MAYFYAVSLQFFWPFFPTAEPEPRLIIRHCQTMWNVVPERLKKETALFWVDRLRRFEKRERDQLENCTISTCTTQKCTTDDTYRLFLIPKTEDLGWRLISWIMISTEEKAIQWILKCQEHQIRYLLRRDVYQWNVLSSTTGARFYILVLECIIFSMHDVGLQMYVPRLHFKLRFSGQRSVSSLSPNPNLHISTNCGLQKVEVTRCKCYKFSIN